jgi:asparagine synthase (glutamine-hydrolysing)
MKPLYYSSNKNNFIFASEIKAIIKDEMVDREVDVEAIHHYLTLQYIPDPQTIIKNIKSLLPAHYLILKEGKIKINKYWDLCFIPKYRYSEEEIIEKLNELILDAVKIRLISDVPLGAFLSGGIDSSIIVGVMSKLSNKPVKTFSIGFGEERYSELKYAKKVAEHFKTDHHEFMVTPKATEILSEIVYFLDQPLADPAVLPTYYLSKLTREYVTVALNGDGGDENFAGYQRYYADKIADLYGKIPLVFRKISSFITDLLPSSAKIPEEKNLFEALRRFNQASFLSSQLSILRWSSYFSKDMKREIYSDWLNEELSKKDTSKILIDSFKSAKAISLLDKTLYVDQHHYLPGDLLCKVDRMSMANSLEARSPFLDYRLMEFVAKIPSSFKMKGFKLKYILKKFAKELLPQDILNRSKQGFGVPVGEWFKRELKEMMHDYLLSQNFQNRNYFKKEAILKLLKEHQSGNKNHGKRIWALLILELWHIKFAEPQ